MTPPRLPVSLLIGLALIRPAPAQRGRYAPPAAVECSRDNLTSYIGAVTRYSRKDGVINLTLNTDDGTVKTMSFRPQEKILIDGREMKDQDWSKIEQKPGSLRPGMRAIFWICGPSRNVLDWRPPHP